MSTTIPRQHRGSFHRFLTHQDPRIRAGAREMAELDAQIQAERQEIRQQEQEIEAHLLDTWSYADESAETELGDTPGEHGTTMSFPSNQALP